MKIKGIKWHWKSKQKLQCSVSHGTIIHINNKACNSPKQIRHGQYLFAKQIRHGQYLFAKQIRHGQYLFAKQQLPWGWGVGGGGSKQGMLTVTSLHNINKDCI